MNYKLRIDRERFIKKDLKEYNPGIARFIRLYTNLGYLAVLVYRIGNWSSKGNSLIRKIIRKLYFVLNLFIEIITGITIGPQAEIGEGFYIGHHGGIIIHPKAILGINCSISQGVTIGVKAPLETKSAPIIGNNVYIGAGAKILGGIKIGNNVIIGANAVVVSDVPSNVISGGIPAKIIKPLNKQNDEVGLN